MVQPFYKGKTSINLRIRIFSTRDPDKDRKYLAYLIDYDLWSWGETDDEAIKNVEHLLSEEVYRLMSV